MRISSWPRAFHFARLTLLGVLTGLTLLFATVPASADIPPEEPAPEKLTPAEQAEIEAARAAMADEAERQRPRRSSGFWMNGRPAKGGAYYYPLLIIGVGVLGITIFTITRYLRRVERARQSRS